MISLFIFLPHTKGRRCMKGYWRIYWSRSQPVVSLRLSHKPSSWIRCRGLIPNASSKGAYLLHNNDFVFVRPRRECYFETPQSPRREGNNRPYALVPKEVRAVQIRRERWGLIPCIYRSTYCGMHLSSEVEYLVQCCLENYMVLIKCRRN